MFDTSIPGDKTAIYTTNGLILEEGDIGAGKEYDDEGSQPDGLSSPTL